MCIQCDGYSHETAINALDLQIRVHGWSLVSVTDGADSARAYTVGLTETYGHPEIALMDIDVERQKPLAKLLVDMVRRHGELDATALRRDGLRWVDVHPDHLGGELFAMWTVRYGAPPEPGDVIQVVAPSCWYCPCHAPFVRRLDRPGPLPPVPSADEIRALHAARLDHPSRGRSRKRR